ncbi:Ubiquitin carboxyl-terminal hydrolase 43 [Collichthys lucidus]|uniref:Ubiquitin carboxyl-terminal hydrolase 43 n=1 Tax=Collichthys lucidus TaxID=240159 RepID=A0A4U5U2G4_COLLU|nr:Ubiquitin carboxyl-terminal hydrolase 43 [Collichthys lucidus]
MVAEEGNISPEQVVLVELYSTGFQRSFSDEDDLTAIADSDVVYAFQAPPLHGRGGSNAPHSAPKQMKHEMPASERQPGPSRKAKFVKIRTRQRVRMFSLAAFRRISAGFERFNLYSFKKASQDSTL